METDMTAFDPERLDALADDVGWLEDTQEERFEMNAALRAFAQVVRVLERSSNFGVFQLWSPWGNPEAEGFHASWPGGGSVGQGPTPLAAILALAAALPGEGE
jgi:hypothetical protein